MAKLSKEFKLEVVRYYLSDTNFDGVKKTGEKFGVGHAKVRQWLAVYSTLGEAGLSYQSDRPVYPTEFKLRVVLSIIENGLSLLDALKCFKLKHIGTISTWVKRYKLYGLEGLIAKPKGRLNRMTKSNKPAPQAPCISEEKTYQALLDEVAYLRTEVAYLKKYNALIREHNKQDISTKPSSRKSSQS